MEGIQAFLNKQVTMQHVIIIIVLTLIFIWQYNKYYFTKKVTGPNPPNVDTSFKDAEGSGSIVDGPAA